MINLNGLHEIGSTESILKTDQKNAKTTVYGRTFSTKVRHGTKY